MKVMNNKLKIILIFGIIAVLFVAQPSYATYIPATVTEEEGQINSTAVTGDVADDQVLIGTGAAAAAWKTVPDCDNSSTSKLLYDQTTNVFSCGTDGGGGVSTLTALTDVSAAGAYTAGNLLIADGTKFISQPISGCTLTSAGVLSCSATLSATGVTAGTYNAGTFVVGTDGRITNATVGSITGLSDVSAANAYTAGNILLANGTKFMSQVISGDVSMTSAGVTDIASSVVGSPEIANSGVTVGTYNVATIVIDADGRITNATTGSITGLNDVVAANAYTAGNLLIANGTKFFSQPISGCTLTSAGALSCSATLSATGVTAGTYNAGTFVVGTDGRITNATVGSITGLSDVSAANAYTAGNILLANGTKFMSQVISGDVSITSAGAVTLAATTVTASFYTSPSITVDAKGRILTAATGSLTGLSDIGVLPKTAGNILIADGTKFNSVALSGCTLTSAGSVTCAAGGGFTDDGAIVRLTTATDDVTLGATTFTAANFAVSPVSNIVYVAGSLGIGTTVPATALDLDSNSSTSSFRLRGADATNEIGDIFVGSSGALILTTKNTGDTDAWIEVDPESPSHGLVVRDGSTGSTSYSDIYMADAGVDYLNINVNSTAAVPVLIINDNDKVGIGTTAITEALDVLGNIEASGSMAAGSITATTSIGIGTTAPATTLQLSGATAPKFSMSDTGIAHGVTTFAPTDSFFQIDQGTNDDGRARVWGFSSAAGTSPMTLIGVFGSTDPTDSVPGISLAAAKRSGTSITDLGAAETLLQVSTGAAGTPLMTILGSGNVGIGITAPTTILDIDSNSNTSSLRLRGADATTEISDIYVGSFGELRITNQNTGDSGAYIEIDPEDDSYGFILRDGNTGTSSFANLYTVDAATDYLNIVVNDVYTAAGLVVDDDNQVGIGNTAPGYQLSVWGGTSEIVAATTGSAEAIDWPQAALSIRRIDNFTTMRMLQLGHVSDSPYQTDNTVWHLSLVDNAGSGTTSSSTTDLYIGGPGDLNLNPNGYVGIGTTTPGTLLEVKGSGGGVINLGQWVGSTAYGGIYLNGGYATAGNYNVLSSPVDPNLYINRPSGYGVRFRENNSTEQVIIATGGNVGIGTSAPYNKFDIVADTSGVGNAQASAGLRIDANTSLNDTAFLVGVDSTANIGYIQTVDPLVSWSTRPLSLQPNGGSVGIGTTAPTGVLQVIGDEVRIGDAGTVNTSTADGDLYVEDNVEVDGSLQVAGTCTGGATCDADIAEEFDALPHIEKGDVVILSSSKYKTVEYSQKPYDDRVLGVISTKPTIIMGNGDFRDNPSPIALSGVVPVKVCLENGSIKIGDNLTSSSTPGVAMKATRPGKVIGFALENYDGVKKEAVSDLTKDKPNQIMHFIDVHWQGDSREKDDHDKKRMETLGVIIKKQQEINERQEEKIDKMQRDLREIKEKLSYIRDRH